MISGCICMCLIFSRLVLGVFALVYQILQILMIILFICFLLVLLTRSGNVSMHIYIKYWKTDEGSFLTNIVHTDNDQGLLPRYNTGAFK